MNVEQSEGGKKTLTMSLGAAVGLTALTVTLICTAVPAGIYVGALSSSVDDNKRDLDALDAWRQLSELKNEEKFKKLIENDMQLQALARIVEDLKDRIANMESKGVK